MVLKTPHDRSWLGIRRTRRKADEIQMKQKTIIRKSFQEWSQIKTSFDSINNVLVVMEIHTLKPRNIWGPFWDNRKRIPNTEEGSWSTDFREQPDCRDGLNLIFHLTSNEWREQSFMTLKNSKCILFMFEILSLLNYIVSVFVSISRWFLLSAQHNLDLPKILCATSNASFI